MINMNAIQELVRSWLNPTALFCIVNLMIGAIFILMTQNKQPTTNDGNNIQETPHHHRRHGPEIVRVPSFIERVRSFNLSKNRSVVEPEQAPEPVRVPSFFERVRSFNLSKNRPAEPEDPGRESLVDRQYGGDISERHEEETGEGGSVIANNKVLKKSASEKVAAQEEAEVERRRPETSRERPVVDDEAVDSKADDFINRFRQQLKMQRLDSILKYREMLNRGASR